MFVSLFKICTSIPKADKSILLEKQTVIFVALSIFVLQLSELMRKPQSEASISASVMTCVI